MLSLIRQSRLTSHRKGLELYILSMKGKTQGGPSIDGHEVTGHQTVATCGGWTGAAREMSSQCLVLNLTYGKGGEWQKGVMGDLLLNQSVTSCPSIEGPPCVFPFIDSMYNSKPFLGDVNLLWRIK